MTISYLLKLEKKTRLGWSSRFFSKGSHDMQCNQLEGSNLYIYFVIIRQK